MSKKTRKKSAKPSPRKAVCAGSKKSTSKPAAKTGAASARKSTAKSAKPVAKASHKDTSKTLKATVTKKSAQTSLGEGGALAEGAKAPAFKLPRDGGGSVSSADYAGRKLVIFFYPRADTPGCTKEAIDFTRLSSAFAEAGTVVLGVSADPQKTQESFRDKHRLTIPLVSDETHVMLDAYGVWGEKSMYGRVFQGILRTTVLIGGNGRIAKIWRNVKVDGHADEVLAAARAL